MDVRVQLRKMAADGKTLLEHRNYHAEDGGARIRNNNDPEDIYSSEDVNIYKFLGSTGMLRASHAVTYNEKLSTRNEPHYDHVSRKLPLCSLNHYISGLVAKSVGPRLGQIRSDPSRHHCANAHRSLADRYDFGSRREPDTTYRWSLAGPARGKCKCKGDTAPLDLRC